MILRSQTCRWSQADSRIRRYPQCRRESLRDRGVGCRSNSNCEHHFLTVLTTSPWQRYWSKLDGDGTVVWADAHLTDVGIEQAKTVNRFWSLEISTQKIAMPETYYTSPLHRCLATAKYTFADLRARPDRPSRPVVKEVSNYQNQ